MARSSPVDWLELPASDGSIIRVRKAPNPRARLLRLTVTPQGARLSCPRNTHPARMLAFVRQHLAWLENKLAELHSEDDAPGLEPGVPNQILLRGKPVPLLWQAAPYPAIRHNTAGITLHLPTPWGPDSLVLARNLIRDFLETSVRRDIAVWLPVLVEAMGRAPTAIRLRVLKSLWGSLDTHNRISLDLSLALAPRKALRYVLAHEMAHLAVRNHSRRFWHRVETLMPDYQPQRIWLRDNGNRLKLEINRLLGDA